MEKIIYVVDSRNSAIHTAASTRATFSSGKILISNEFIRPLHLLKFIYKEEGGIVLFCWRKALADIISVKTSLKFYNKLDEKFTFAFLIPDHLGASTVFKKIEAKMIKSSDYYLVTSRILFDQYSMKYPTQIPRAIFHDLPNLRLINDVRNRYQKKINSKNHLIWVGNSKWGHRQGIVDHKRFEQFIKPFQIFLTKTDCCKLEIVNSAKKYVPSYSVLKAIRNSDLLLQVSRSEGTGLPILEALGLETSVISSKVGIVEEIFEQSDLRIEDSLNFFKIHEKIHKILDANSQSELRLKFDNFIKQALNENLISTFERVTASSELKWLSRVKIYLFWFYRYLYNHQSNVSKKYFR